MQITNAAGEVVYEYDETLGGSAYGIGIGVTTRNRPEVLARTLTEIRRLTPGAKLVVVDDASTEPVEDAIRFDENVGIARAKNACLEALYADPTIQHFFLFDDDAYPLVENWWEPYVESPEPHLMRIFPDLLNEPKLNDIKVIYEGDGHVAYTGPRGVLLYVHRSVLEVVGGMDTAYGKWGYEHGDWSNRIHNAGLTTFRFADVIGGERLIYSMDEHSEVDRGTGRHERNEAVKSNVKLYYANWDSAEYKEFRQTKNVILTCLFMGKDPQRPHAKMNLGMLQPLMETLQGCEAVVFTNETYTALDDSWHFGTHVDLGTENVYFQRWITYWRWLRDHPEVEYVWCVDGTDVKLLRDPWELDYGTLYVGSEQHTISTPWLRENHPLAEVGITIDMHPDAILLNAGLIGGDRVTVMEFIFDIIHQWQTAEINVFHKKGESPGIGDMGVLNVVGHSPKWQGRIHTGPDVNTIFKQNQTADQAPEARWAHK